MTCTKDLFNSSVKRIFINNSLFLFNLYSLNKYLLIAYCVKCSLGHSVNSCKLDRKTLFSHETYIVIGWVVGEGEINQSTWRSWLVTFTALLLYINLHVYYYLLVCSNATAFLYILFFLMLLICICYLVK